MIFPFWYFLYIWSVSTKQTILKKRRFKATCQRWKSTTCLNGWFASKLLFCCHLCSVLQICSTLKGLAKRKYLPCALKHTIRWLSPVREDLRLSTWCSLVLIEQKSALTSLHSCVQSWAATANHKIKCLNTFREQGARPEGFAWVCIYTFKQADTSDFQSSPIKKATLTP